MQMSNKIVFATNNKNKLTEIRDILGSQFDIVSLEDIGCHDDIPETGDTLQANAKQKADYVREHYGLTCFADDTGLEVEALGGEPGIYSARYAALDGAGESHDSEANMTKLLKRLDEAARKSGVDNRKARFRTVISYISDTEEVLFEGIVEGHISHERSGAEGFGYDPIFVPEGYDKSFAELGNDIKNQISHRSRAVKKLADFLAKKA